MRKRIGERELVHDNFFRFSLGWTNTYDRRFWGGTFFCFSFLPPPVKAGVLVDWIGSSLGFGGEEFPTLLCLFFFFPFLGRENFIIIASCVHIPKKLHL
jgi:hypothetical protein